MRLILAIVMALTFSVPASAQVVEWLWGVDGGGSGSGGGVTGGGALDDLISAEDCDDTTPSELHITAASGVHYISTSAVCNVAGTDKIIIPNLSTFDADATLLLSVVNDSGVDLIVDASANASGVINEAGSDVVPDGTTFSVVQTAASSVHIIGTGAGVTHSVAGVDGADDTHDPRDLDEDETYDDAIACASGRCTFESNTGNLWTYDSTNSLWRCDTCQQHIPRQLNKGLEMDAGGAEDGGTGANCFRLSSGGNMPPMLVGNLVSNCTFGPGLFFFPASTSSDLSTGNRFVLERFCMVATSNYTGDIGIQLELLDTSGTRSVASFHFPSAPDTELTGHNVCATGLPVILSNTVGTSLAIKA
jgi:hypothetical protein